MRLTKGMCILPQEVPRVISAGSWAGPPSLCCLLPAFCLLPPAPRLLPRLLLSCAAMRAVLAAVCAALPAGLVAPLALTGPCWRHHKAAFTAHRLTCGAKEQAGKNRNHAAQSSVCRQHQCTCSARHTLCRAHLEQDNGQDTRTLAGNNGYLAVVL